MLAWLQTLDPIAQAGLFTALGVAVGKVFDVWIARIRTDEETTTDPGNDYTALLEDLQLERGLRRDSERANREIQTDLDRVRRERDEAKELALERGLSAKACQQSLVERGEVLALLQATLSALERDKANLEADNAGLRALLERSR